jgi:SH3-like domain-containing protein
MLQKPTNFKRFVMLGSVLTGLAFSFTALALEFRSVAVTKVISYDAPSKEASKLFVLGNGYPLEVIVNLGDWIKVRDALGGLSWIEAKSLSAKRTVLVLAKTDIKTAEDSAAALVATVEKDVVLELVAGATKSGWQKVKHRDGAIGFVQSTALWGAN